MYHLFLVFTCDGATRFSIKYSDVRGSVHHNIVHIKIQQDATLYQNIILYLYEAQHISGDTPPIIRSLKLHKQPLVLHAWKVIGRAVAGRCQVEYTLSDSVQELHVQQPSTHSKPEAACAVLGS
jgi:hypothetical protein